MTVHVDGSLRLPTSEYFASRQAKSGIALHHTVCDSARTTLDLWRRDQAAGGKPNRVATAFVVDKDGSMTRLVVANADAYETGFEAAFAGDQDLSKRHIAELKKPRIRLASALGLLGAAGVGFVIGRATL